MIDLYWICSQLIIPHNHVRANSPAARDTDVATSFAALRGSNPIATRVFSRLRKTLSMQCIDIIH